jgi:hypothetical protein
VTAVLHAAIPADWRPYSARDVVVIARPPADTGWFCTTVLLGRDEVGTDVPLAALLDGTETTLEGIGDEVEVVGQRFSVDHDHERASRLVCFDVTGRPGRVVQLQCFVALRAGSARTRTVVQFAGTCAFDELDRYGPVFVRVIESIRLDRGAGDPG